MTMAAKKTLLVCGSVVMKELPELSPYAEVYSLDQLSQPILDSILGSVDCMLVGELWPRALNGETLTRMNHLRFIQLGFAGANHVPFQNLPPGVTICSNAGGFSTGVAEYTWALVLAAAKRITRFDTALRNGEHSPDFFSKTLKGVALLQGRSLAIIGYGGIGHKVALFGRAFGMEVLAYSRHAQPEPETRTFQGREGLLQMLRMADVVVVSIALTNKTQGLIGAQELSAMKPDAILVNIARSEILNEQELYKHMITNPGFTYATDVWHRVAGVDARSSTVPFLEMDNFIGTPHVSGPSEMATGDPIRLAVENLLRYLKGESPRNVVDISEYT
jgi:phosphoglycerate dehydrogenase-like enzyme